MVLIVGISFCNGAGGNVLFDSFSSCGDSTTGVSWCVFCQNLDVLAFFLRLLTDISSFELLFADSLDGDCEFERPRNSDKEVFSLKLGRLKLVAIE